MQEMMSKEGVGTYEEVIRTYACVLARDMQCWQCLARAGYLRSGVGCLVEEARKEQKVGVGWVTLPIIHCSLVVWLELLSPHGTLA